MDDMRILFVCLGNICRSPIAEGVFRNLVQTKGISERFIIDSAGTGGWHVGTAPDERAQRVLLDKGIDISQLKARQFCEDDFRDFDLIIAMDRSNYSNIMKVAGAGNSDVRLLLSYVNGSKDEDVPDPYYGGFDGFEQVYQMVNEACERLLATIDMG